MALRLRGATSGYIELKAPASAGDNTLTLPVNNGSANQILKTDGNGNLSWVDDANTQLTFSNDSNNRVITGTGSGLNAEANFTFDGNDLTISHSGLAVNIFESTDNHSRLRIKSGDSSLAQLEFADQSDADAGEIRYDHINDVMTFHVGNNAERLCILSGGNVGIGTSSPITKLNVNSGTTDLAAQLVSSDANVFLAFKDGDASGNQQVQIGGVGNNFVAFAGGDERFKIESTGRTFVKTDESTTGLVVQNTVHDSQLRIEASAANKNSVIQFADGADGDVGIIDYDHNDNSLAITVNTNERLRIESDGSSKFTGNITFGANDTYKIGTNSTKVNEIVSTKFVHRYGSSSGTAINEAEAIWYGGAVHVYHDNITCSSTSFLNAFTGNRSFPLILVHQEGSGAAINAEDGAITEGSDYRIKENITTLENGIDKVKTLKPITYTLKKSWKPNGKGEIYHGFVAHEVSESLSGITGIVCGEKDAMAPELYSEQDELDGKIPSGKKIGDETGNMTTDMAIQGIDYGRLTPIITSALKEAIAKIETLETKVAALESA